MSLRLHLAAIFWAVHLPFSTACPGVIARQGTGDAQSLLAKAVDAMGGHEALNNITGLTMTASDIYRSQTLLQSYVMNHSDVFLASRGSQTVSYKYSPGLLQQSIDRVYTLDSYWIWAIPDLNPPMSFSLVVEASNNSVAFFRNGSNSLIAEPGNLGYADSSLTQYLAGEAQRSDPLLAFRLSQRKNLETIKLNVRKVDVLAVFDPSSGITLALHPDTHLPWFVRREEYNRIFGHSTNDIFFTDYRPVNFSGLSMILPHRRQMIYNYEQVEDTIFDNITINPRFASDQFAIRPSSSDTFSSPHKLDTPLTNWSVADIGPFYESAFWSGEFSRTLDNVTASHPIPSLPQLWRLDFADSEGNPGGYGQLVVEIEDGVLVADSPYYLSKIVLDWIAKEIKKPVRYLWPSHHHHDHAYGAADYVAAGAKMVVPAVAKNYWSRIPNNTIITFDEKKPWVASDGKVQISAAWRPDAPHSEDWSWLAVTKANPKEGDDMVIFEADAWDPDPENETTDMSLTWQWLGWLAEDGVSNNTIVASAHGGNHVLQELIDVTGYPYPKKS